MSLSSASTRHASPSNTGARTPSERAPLLRWRAGLAGVLTCLAFNAGAQNATPAPGVDWSETARQWIGEQALGQMAAGTPLRPEVEIGQLDSRLRLAPCAKVEPYLPAGTRLWGRSRIGLRCVQGPVAWNVFLPVTVRVWGPAWVVRQPVPQRETLTQEHAELAETDWTESNSPVLLRKEDWIGSEAARFLAPGQVLRQGMVKTPQVFSAGTQVRVRVQGTGFTLTATGEAMTHGHLGETARVKMPNRKVLTGTVRDGETVEVAL